MRKVNSSLSFPSRPGRRKEISPAASTSVTVSAADQSHHSCLSILRKCAAGLSSGCRLVTDNSESFIRSLHGRRDMAADITWIAHGHIRQRRAHLYCRGLLANGLPGLVRNAQEYGHYFGVKLSSCKSPDFVLCILER